MQGRPAGQLGLRRRRRHCAFGAARRAGGNFNRFAGWPHAVRVIGAEGLHFHDLRHTGNHFAAASAAASGVGLRDLMARMGHDSERAALIHQHQARRAYEAITDALDAHVESDQDRDTDGDDGALRPRKAAHVS